MVQTVGHESMLMRADDTLRRLIGSGLLTAAIVAAAWGVVAVIAATTAFIAVNGNTLGLWLRLIQPMMLYYGTWAAMSLLIYRVVELGSGTWRRRMAGAATHLALLALILGTMPFLIHGEQWREWLYGARAPGFQSLAVVIYALILGGSLLIRFYRLSLEREREVRDARLRNSLLENQLNLARMDALKMQINPHFLFNALNSIAALIETSRNVEAYHTTELLGGLLRSALDQSSERVLALESELEFVQRYLQVEKVRFGSRFVFERDIDESCLSFEVPALILQPLIENSIKHAVGPSGRSVTIRLEAALNAAGELLLRLTDDGPGFGTATSQGCGYGLRNIRRRIELLYGDAASFEVRNRDRGGVVAELRIPPLNSE